MKKQISLAKDFSRVPAGRYIKDGKYSGERFREEFLIKFLKDETISKLIVDLDDTNGIGSSFLEEAFGGLIRQGISYDLISQKLVVTSKEDGFDKNALKYIEEEQARQVKK